jgi:peptidyl-tRNA hydrolase
MDPADYVLQDFSGSELPVVSEMIERAVEAITLFLEEGIELTMTRYNS